VCLRNALSYGQAVSEAGPPRTEGLMLLYIYIFVYVPRRFHTRSSRIMSFTREGERSLVYVQTMLRFFLAVPYCIGLGEWEF
jgi:hypothetical protein